MNYYVQPIRAMRRWKHPADSNVLFFADFAGFLCEDQSLDVVISVVSSSEDLVVSATHPNGTTFEIYDGTIVKYALSGGKDGVEYDVTISPRVAETLEILHRVFPVRVSTGRWKSM